MSDKTVSAKTLFLKIRFLISNTFKLYIVLYIFYCMLIFRVRLGVLNDRVNTTSVKINQTHFRNTSVSSVCVTFCNLTNKRDLLHRGGIQGRLWF